MVPQSGHSPAEIMGLYKKLSHLKETFVEMAEPSGNDLSGMPPGHTTALQSK